MAKDQVIVTGDGGVIDLVDGVARQWAKSLQNTCMSMDALLGPSLRMI